MQTNKQKIKSKNETKNFVGSSEGEGFWNLEFCEW